MLTEIMAGLPDSGLALAVPALCAGLGGWAAGFALRYASLLDAACRESAHPAPDPAQSGGQYYPDGLSLLGAAIGPGKPATSWGKATSGRRGLVYGVAALTGVLVFILQGRHGLTPMLAATVVALVLLLVLAIVDANTLLLPDALTLPLLWLGLLLAWAGGDVSLHDAVAGAMAGYVFLSVLFLGFKWVRKQDGMGYGDFKLTAALGAWVGYMQLPFVLLIACVLGVAFAICRHKSPVSASVYPFGPFLAAGGITVMVFIPGVHSYF